MTKLINRLFAALIVVVLSSLISVNVSFAAETAKPSTPGTKITKVTTGKCTDLSQCWIVTFDNNFVGEVYLTTHVKSDDPYAGIVSNIEPWRSCAFCAKAYQMTQGNGKNKKTFQVYPR